LEVELEEVVQEVELEEVDEPYAPEPHARVLAAARINDGGEGGGFVLFF
jgi:hypothetical protein